jgi:hypothetical protein
MSVNAAKLKKISRPRAEGMREREQRADSAAIPRSGIQGEKP